jgi:hypothetical protein
MKLLPGEHILYEASGGIVKVTTHRIRYDWQESGTGVIKSIMLEEVASCTVTRQSSPWLSAVAAICVLGGLIAEAGSERGALVGGLFLGAIFWIAYWLTRKQVITIASARATIFLNAKSWPLEEVRELLDLIEAAKNTRYLKEPIRSGIVEGPQAQQGQNLCPACGGRNLSDSRFCAFCKGPLS